MIYNLPKATQSISGKTKLASGRKLLKSKIYHLNKITSYKKKEIICKNSVYRFPIIITTEHFRKPLSFHHFNYH